MNDKVLVDTGIWIDYLHGNSSVSKLQNLLEENLVCTHILIEGELRAGSIKNRETFFDAFTKLNYLPKISDNIIFRFIEDKKLFGKGLSIIDIHIYASAKAENVKIWTRDKNLLEISKQANLAFNI